MSSRWLEGINPLAKLVGPLPAIIALLFARDLVTPAIFIVIAVALIASGTRWTRLTTICLLVVLPAAVVAIGFGLSLWTDPSRVADTPALFSIGQWTLHTGAFAIGGATGLRLGAIVALSFIGGLSTTGPDLVRSLVQNARMPYRIGYAALAAYRFVPRFRYELDVIRSAHRVRGKSSGFGFDHAIPLLAGAIRHAERVALAMDSRAFGAYPTRTERYLVPWRVRDTVFVVASWTATLTIFIGTTLATF